MTMDEMTLSEINEVGNQWADMMGAYWTVRCHVLAHSRLNAHIRNELRAKGIEPSDEVKAKLDQLDASVAEMRELQDKVRAQCDDLSYWFERATPKGFPQLTMQYRSPRRS